MHSVRTVAVINGPGPQAAGSNQAALVEFEAMKPFDPNARYLGGYHPLDGTLEFFGRLHSVLRPTDTVIDVGAGRGAWYFEDRCSARRAVRDIKPHVKAYIGVDIDPVVMTNPTTTENIVMDATMPLPALSADVVLADYVLEH